MNMAKTDEKKKEGKTDFQAVWLWVDRNTAYLPLELALAFVKDISI